MLSKYSPLKAFLGRQLTSNVPMTFFEIERVLGFHLPDSQKHRAWWSNNPSNNVMTRAWLDAGFETEQVDVERRKLVFRRRRRMPLQMPVKASTAAPAAVKSQPSFFGWMKGTISIPAGTDLTEPADPQWGARSSDQ